MSPDSFVRRVRQEWELADVIVVNSRYAKTCIEESGARTERIVTVPLAVPSGIWTPVSAAELRKPRSWHCGRATSTS